MKKILMIALVAISIISCKKSDEEVTKAGIFKGPVVEVQHGKGWSWTKLDKNGNPEQLGISIDDAAINSMPTSNPTGGGHTHENNVVFSLHEKAKTATPFKFVSVDWNPTGHEPSGIYDKPHFDFHFYLVPQAEVLASVDLAKLDKDPPAGYLPANYVPGAPVPQMGKHFVDVTSSEFTGQPFTQTFIYGTYDGAVTFYEPMITLAFLKANSNYERPIPQPARFKYSGYFPTKMRVTRQDGVTNVILDWFVYRQAS